MNHDACLFVARKRSAADSAAKKGKRATRAETLVASISKNGQEEDKWNWLAERRFEHQFKTDAEAWADEPDTRFETRYSPAIAKTLTSLATSCRPLGSICDVTVGIQVYHRRKVDQDTIRNKLFHSTRRKGAKWFPFMNGKEVQRYFDAPSDRAYLKYSDLLCDARPLSHYSEPRILVQQIFWGRMAAVYQKPEEPYLYLNTLFSCSKFREEFDLHFALLVLNSRVASACYERWTNRLFGNKFPKVSKADLASFPIPSPKKETRNRMASTARELSSAWTALKQVTRKFHAFATIAGEGPHLSCAKGAFWDVEEQAFAGLLAQSNLTHDARMSFWTRWEQDSKAVRALWKEILLLEERAEQSVQSAYGLSDAVCEEILGRSPAVQLKDVLLPK